jgi:hypothetical protein
MSVSNIQYVQHHNIDFEKWDSALINSINARVYACTYFLNLICKHWDALILGNYEFIMPLPYKVKYGIHYIYPPTFVQQLGIFSSNEISKEMLESFLIAIPRKFKYCEIKLNSENPFQFHNHIHRKNFLLELNKPYSELKQNYSRSAKRNIQLAIENSVKIEEVDNAEQTIILHRERFKDKIGANANDYSLLENIFNKFYACNQNINLIAKNKDGKIIASSSYLIYKERITFLLNGNSTESLQKGATHLLKDYMIQKYSNSNYILDFEGSDDINFARFYQQFGKLKMEVYPHFILNKLPFYIKWLKSSMVKF